MTEPMSVTKYGQGLTISAEWLAGGEAMAAAIQRWRDATPEEHAEWARQAGQRAAEERAAAETVPLTLGTLLARVERWGWSREYVAHLVQPYCDCEDGRDGWEYCRHARDLGFDA